MSVTITLPDKLAESLQPRAEAQQVSLDELVADILAESFAAEPEDNFPTL